MEKESESCKKVKVEVSMEQAQGTDPPSPAQAVSGSGGEGEGTSRRQRLHRQAHTRSEMEAKARKRADNLKTALRPNNVSWSGVEKAKLLRGLQALGSRDLDALAEWVPHRTPEGVGFYINKEKKDMQMIEREIEVPGPSFQSEVRREKRSMDAPIEKWIFKVEDDTPLGTKRSDVGHVLPEMLDWISQYEDHPDPGDAEGVNYAAIYRHFAHLMTGDVPPDLDKPTADRVIQLFVTLKDSVREALPTMGKVVETLRSRHTYLEVPSHAGASGGQPDVSQPSAAETDKMIADALPHQFPGMDPLKLHEKFSGKRDPGRPT